MITENLSTLKIHKLTQEQYDRALAEGNINKNEFYLTPDTDSVSITKTEINNNGELIITLSDNTVSNLGRVVGVDGYIPQKGVDYYTEADKAEMVQAVLAALPNGDEVEY